MTPLAEWQRCLPWIEAATEANGLYTVEYIEGEINAGRMVFWPLQNGAVLTDIVNYPRGRALNIFAAAGEPNASLVEMLEEAEPALVAFAMANGCRWVMGYGRPGWQRQCKSMGYSPKWTVIAKELPNVG